MCVVIIIFYLYEKYNRYLYEAFSSTIENHWRVSPVRLAGLKRMGGRSSILSLPSSREDVGVYCCEFRSLILLSDSLQARVQATVLEEIDLLTA